MIFCVDIGNSNIVYGCYDGDRPVFLSRVATDPRRMSDQYAVELHSIFAIHGVRHELVSAAIISSVVPIVTSSISEAVATALGIEPVVVKPAEYTNMRIKLDSPRELGSDLLATAVAARAKYPLPVVIIDMGTATKMTVVSRDGAFLGGAIMPGLRVATDALVERTSLLPGVSLQPPEAAIGTNTSDCMRSGVVLGSAAMLDGMYERMCAELGERASAVITGGLAGVVAPECRAPLVRDDTLLLDGLRIMLVERGAPSAAKEKQ